MKHLNPFHNTSSGIIFKKKYYKVRKYKPLSSASLSIGQFIEPAVSQATQSPALQATGGIRVPEQFIQPFVCGITPAQCQTSKQTVEGDLHACDTKDHGKPNK